MTSDIGLCATSGQLPAEALHRISLVCRRRENRSRISDWDRERTLELEAGSWQLGLDWKRKREAEAI